MCTGRVRDNEFVEISDMLMTQIPGGAPNAHRGHAGALAS